MTSIQPNNKHDGGFQSRRDAMKTAMVSAMASLQNTPTGGTGEKQASATSEKNPIARPFQGLLVDNGKVYTNWGLSNSTKPAVYVEPINYEDVQAIVKDSGRFPSPVSPVGAMLSVSPTVVNDGGTLLCTLKLDEIKGIETDSRGRKIVRVQAGCRLKKLHVWLQSKGLEIPFQAEIGEATVGSVAVGDTKDSSLNGAGFFSAGVTGITYVNASGEIKTITDSDDGVDFYEFKCSFGLLGIVIECQIEVRPATLCTSRYSLHRFKSPDELADELVRLYRGSDAFFASVVLEKLFATCDQRYHAGPGSLTPGSSQPLFDQLRIAKRSVIQHGGFPRPNTDNLQAPIREITYSRADMVNEYWRPTVSEKRLDFQYYEHDLSNIKEVVSQSYAFSRAFAEKHSFVPNSWALYFVNRPESKKKPHGLYSGGKGVSFSFDPIFSNPSDPNWQLFAKEYNSLAIKTLHGRPSPIQTQWLKSGDLLIPKKLSHPRFTTKYYSQFLG